MTVGMFGHNCKAFPPLYFFKDAHTECHPKLSLRVFNLLILHRLKKRSDNPLEIVTEG